MMRMLSKGFTLIELMIVVGIITLLAAFAIPSYVSYRNTAHAQVCKKNMELIRSACHSYWANHSTYTEDLNVLIGKDKNGLLREDIACPIKGNYTIKFDSETQDFIITCDKNNDEHNVNNAN